MLGESFLWTCRCKALAKRARKWTQDLNLRLLALTLVEITFVRESTQVFHRLAAQLKSAQVE